MSMSDCEKCYNTPCTCGWEYKHWSEEALESQIEMLENILKFKQKYHTLKVERVVLFNYNQTSVVLDHLPLLIQAHIPSGTTLKKVKFWWEDK